MLQTDINVYSQTWFLIKKSVSIISSITSVYQSVTNEKTQKSEKFQNSKILKKQKIAND